MQSCVCVFLAHCRLRPFFLSSSSYPSCVVRLFFPPLFFCSKLVLLFGRTEARQHFCRYAFHAGESVFRLSPTSAAAKSKSTRSPPTAAAGNMIRIFGYQHQTAVAVVIVNLCFYFLLLVSGNIQHITPNSDSSQTDIKSDTCQFSIQFLNAHAIHFNYNIVSHLYDFLFRPTF